MTGKKAIAASLLGTVSQHEASQEGTGGTCATLPGREWKQLAFLPSLRQASFQTPRPLPPGGTL